jgi:hypothetical protein
MQIPDCCLCLYTTSLTLARCFELALHTMEKRAQIDDIFHRTEGLVKIQCQSRADYMGMKQLCGEF